MESFATVRLRRGYSQKALAEEAEVSPVTIHKIERGHPITQARVGRNLCRVLCVRAHDITEFQHMPPWDFADNGGVFEEIPLHRARDFSGLSQAALAAEAGVSYGLVRRLEKGGTTHRVTALARIAEALGCGVQEIMELRASLDRCIGSQPVLPPNTGPKPTLRVLIKPEHVEQAVWDGWDRRRQRRCVDRYIKEPSF